MTNVDKNPINSLWCFRKDVPRGSPRFHLVSCWREAQKKGCACPVTVYLAQWSDTYRHKKGLFSKQAQKLEGAAQKKEFHPHLNSLT